MVGRDARVAGVVGVGPGTVRRGLVARPAEVAHRPGARPEALHSRGPGERDGDFEGAAFEAGLVPALQHAGAVVELVVGKVVHLQVQRAVGRAGRVRVIPFQVHRRAVPEVRRGPVRVVSRVEGAARVVEFVAEDELELGAVDGLARHGVGGGRGVDEAGAQVLEEGVVAVVDVVPVELVRVVAVDVRVGRADVRGDAAAHGEDGDDDEARDESAKEQGHPDQRTDLSSHEVVANNGLVPDVVVFARCVQVVILLLLVEVHGEVVAILRQAWSAYSIIQKGEKEPFGPDPRWVPRFFSSLYRVLSRFTPAPRSLPFPLQPSCQR